MQHPTRFHLSNRAFNHSPQTKHLIWNNPATRPPALNLNQALKITLLYLLQNYSPHRKALLELEELKTPDLESLKEPPRIPRRQWHLDSGEGTGLRKCDHCFQVSTKELDITTR